MTPLRAKYIRDLVIRGRSKHTQEAYTRYVRDLARYYRRSPELISYEEVTDWLYHLIKERPLLRNLIWRQEPYAILLKCPDHGFAISLIVPRNAVVSQKRKELFPIFMKSF